MSEGNFIRVQELEQSLIQFLMNKKEVEDKMGGGFRRIRTLQLYVSLSPKNQKFRVQIGMFEAEFAVKTGLKEKGNCFNLERYIRDWAERESIANSMLTILNRGRVVKSN